MTAMKLEIEGMSCNHCVHAVRTALEGVAGVRVLDVSIGEATVELAAGTQLSALIDAVDDAGYAATERRG